jgi:TolB-like protein
MKFKLQAVMLALAACASEPKVDVIAESYGAADALYKGARRELPDDSTIVYGVFTPVGKPDASSPFGRMFAELVASRLVQNGVKVVEVRLREAIAVREGGPYALSDDVRDVARRVHARAALSGSYALAPDYVVVSARLIDVSTGLVFTSWDKRIPLSRTDQSLFGRPTDPFGRPTDPWGLSYHVWSR